MANAPLDVQNVQKHVSSDIHELGETIQNRGKKVIEDVRFKLNLTYSEM